MSFKIVQLNPAVTDALALAADATRVFLYIHNYSTSGETFWLNFDAPAVVGSGLEIIAGNAGDLVFGSNLSNNPIPPFYTNNCPQNAIHIISAAGTAKGYLLVNTLPP